jgi:hypothetical protein
MVGGLQRVLVDVEKVARSAEVGRAADEGRAAKGGRDHGEVEVDVTPVLGVEPIDRSVDVCEVEVRQPGHVLLGEQLLDGGVRLGRGEECRQRAEVGDVDAITHAAAGEVPVREQAELQWRDGALDGRVHDADDETSLVEAVERGGESRGALELVERVHALVPPRPDESGRHLGRRRGPGGDHQDVVGEGGAVAQDDLVPVDVDAIDLTFDEVDARAQLLTPWPYDVVRTSEPEGDGHLAGLVDVAIVAVDHRDARLRHVVGPT